MRISALELARGRYRARLALGAADLAAVQRLRHLAFIVGAGAAPRPSGRDRDAFDRRCRHVLVEDLAGGDPVCCFRLLPLAGGAAIGDSYSAQFYDLGALAAFPGRIAEVGRFCLHPERRDADILRLAWAALTRLADEIRAALLFGCSSFRGIDPATHAAAFALLRDRHLAPPRWRPREKAPGRVRFGPGPAADPAAALRGMPPLLRSYLRLGGWVSDHAVVDRELNTLHVFTALETGRIPPDRARRLRALAG